MASIEVVVTPGLLPLYEVKGKTVVVIDILRATTSICVAFDTGAERILPVATPDECILFRDFDFLCAAERNAVKLDGFDLGNSPFEFQNPLIAGRRIALTTTNGTRAIRMSKEMGAGEVIVGSFLNLDAVVKRLIDAGRPALLLCAGWKDKLNLEDFLYAGAVAAGLQNSFTCDCDSTVAAQSLWELHRHDALAYVRRSSHARRFTELHTGTDDVAFCMQMNTTHRVPVLKGEYLVAS
jgi:2-phosphosulfolactate phosphatase